MEEIKELKLEKEEKLELVKIMILEKNSNVAYIINTLLHILYKNDKIKIEIYSIK